MGCAKESTVTPPVPKKPDLKYDDQQKELLSVLNGDLFLESFRNMADVQSYLENWGTPKEVYGHIGDSSSEYWDDNSDIYDEDGLIVATYKKDDKSLYMTSLFSNDFTTYTVKEYLDFVYNEINLIGAYAGFMDHYKEAIQSYYPEANMSLLTQVSKDAHAVQKQYEKIAELIEEEKKFTKEIYKQIHSTELDQYKMILSFMHVLEGMGMFVQGSFEASEDESLSEAYEDNIQSFDKKEMSEFAASYTILGSNEYTRAAMYFLHDTLMLLAWEDLAPELDYLSEEDQKNIKKLVESSLQRIIVNFDDLSTLDFFKHEPYKAILKEWKKDISSPETKKEFLKTEHPSIRSYLIYYFEEHSDLYESN